MQASFSIHFTVFWCQYLSFETLNRSIYTMSYQPKRQVVPPSHYYLPIQLSVASYAPDWTLWFCIKMMKVLTGSYSVLGDQRLYAGSSPTTDPKQFYKKGCYVNLFRYCNLDLLSFFWAASPLVFLSVTSTLIEPFGHVQMRVNPSRGQGTSQRDSYWPPSLVK